MEKTLVIIKPDAIERNLVDEVFKELDAIGKRIKTVVVEKISPEKIEEHYKDSIIKHGELLRKKLVFFNNKKIILALYKGKDIIKKIKDKVGTTDPAKSGAGTIRKKWADDSFDKAMTEGRFIRNLVHASGSKEEFEKEFEIWKEFF